MVVAVVEEVAIPIFRMIAKPHGPVILEDNWAALVVPLVPRDALADYRTMLARLRAPLAHRATTLLDRRAAVVSGGGTFRNGATLDRLVRTVFVRNGVRSDAAERKTQHAQGREPDHLWPDHMCWTMQASCAVHSKTFRDRFLSARRITTSVCSTLPAWHRSTRPVGSYCEASPNEDQAIWLPSCVIGLYASSGENPRRPRSLR